MISAREVVLFHVQSVGHDKFMVCVDPDLGIFFYINTREGRPPEDQVPVTPAELPCLSYPSYINVSKPMSFPMAVVDTAVSNQPGRRVGRLPPIVCQRVAEAVEQSRVLERKYKAAIIVNLNANLSP